MLFYYNVEFPFYAIKIYGYTDFHERSSEDKMKGQCCNSKEFRISVKVAVVIGSNKCVDYCLAKQFHGVVYLTGIIALNFTKPN